MEKVTKEISEQLDENQNFGKSEKERKRDERAKKKKEKKERELEEKSLKDTLKKEAKDKKKKGKDDTKSKTGEGDTVSVSSLNSSSKKSSFFSGLFSKKGI